ncbi:MAG: hypothetical protein WA799_00335 [Nitrosotalea sp.]
MDKDRESIVNGLLADGALTVMVAFFPPVCNDIVFYRIAIVCQEIK